MGYSVRHSQHPGRICVGTIGRGWWRSVEHSDTGFVVNSFLGEVAAAAGRDAYKLRMDLLEQAASVALEATLAKKYRNIGSFIFNIDRYRNLSLLRFLAAYAS